MTPDKRLAEVFDRGLRDGVDALSPADRDLYRIQDFIIEFEMGGLPGYLYNRLPDLPGVTEAVEAMRRYGLHAMAALLGQAVGMFAGYSRSEPPGTWGEILRRYDPTDRLAEMGHRIRTLDNYGLGEASIH